MSQSLTPQQRHGLDALRRLTIDGVPPSYEALRVELGLSNRSGAHRLLRELRARGVVDWVPGKSRSIRILDDQFTDAELARMSGAALARVIRTAHAILCDRGAA